MKKTRPTMPRARTEELVIEELPDETLVYDLKRHKAHCLNHTAAAVWRHCDGSTPISQLALILEEESDLPRDQGIVHLALDRLQKAKLLEDGFDGPENGISHSRRDLVKKLALFGGAMMLPVVSSITSPAAAMQASTTTRAACESSCTGLGLPCSDRPGKTCRTWKNGCACRN